MSKYSVGLQNAGSYLVSGRPFVARRSVGAGQEISVSLPEVTKNVTIRIPSPPNVAVNIGNQDGSWLSSSEQRRSDSYLPEVGGAGKDFTFSFWMKDPLTNTNTLLMTFFLANGGFNNQISLKYNSSAARNYGIEGAGGNAAVSAFYNTSVTANDAEWHHIVFTQEGGNLYLYIDGNQGGGAAYAGELPAVIDNIKLGWNGSGGIDSAKYDEVTFFSAGFTQADVTELYNSGEWFNPKSHAQAANLVAWWTLGDTAGDGRPVGSFTGFPYTIPPDAALGVNGPAFFYNNGDTTERNLHAIYFDGVGGTDFAELVTGPFTSQTTGKLRFHLLSTSSSPHGANVIANKHYRELQGYNTTISLPMKTKELYFTGVGAQVTFEVIAELTNIPEGRMYALTGSGIDE
jgi:hypothetical protein